MGLTVIKVSLTNFKVSLTLITVRPMVSRAGYVVEISADSIKDAEDTASKMRMTKRGAAALCTSLVGTCTLSHYFL